MTSKTPAKDDFDKYKFYLDSVQSPEDDAELLAKIYWEVFNRNPKILREDFCAAFALCCEWVKLKDDKKAIGIDLDPEPLNYGREHYLADLTEQQKGRVKIIQADVCGTDLPSADIICALNFSYMGFKERPKLKEYIKQCYKGLPEEGLLIFDCFGGSSTQEPNEHETEYDGFSYFWDQDSFNHLTAEAQFYIHYKIKGERKREKVFSYDWRMWSLAELRDLFKEVGFSDVQIYWEGTDEDGDGDGQFTRTETGEDCESWVAYIVAVKKKLV